MMNAWDKKHFLLKIYEKMTLFKNVKSNKKTFKVTEDADP